MERLERTSTHRNVGDVFLAIAQIHDDFEDAATGGNDSVLRHGLIVAQTRKNPGKENPAGAIALRWVVGRDQNGGVE